MTAVAAAPPAEDARASNWRYVIPAQPADPLVLQPGVAMDDLLPATAVAAVVAPDVRGTADLTTLAAAVAPGGWLCAGFANRRYPAAPLRRGSTTLRVARSALMRAGMVPTATYAALPDHRHPALLVPVDGAAELDHVLRRMLLTYVPHGTPLPRLARRAMWAARAVATATPHRLRVGLLPGYVLLARRPSEDPS